MEGARAATPADVPRLAELAHAARTELLAFRGGDVLFAARAGTTEDDRLARAIDEPDVLVLAGTIDHTIMGYAIVRTERLADGRVLGVIDDLYVEEGARAVGVGEAMMGPLLDWCRSRGCSGIDALALPGHRTTKNFFEESGFTARLLVMHRSLATQ